MSASPRPIVFNLKRCWYDAIARGEKRVEYRDVKPYWTKRLDDAHLRRADNQCIFRLGYDPSHDIFATITDIDVGPCPYPGWEGTYYRIRFSVNNAKGETR